MNEIIAKLAAIGLDEKSEAYDLYHFFEFYELTLDPVGDDRDRPFPTGLVSLLVEDMDVSIDEATEVLRKIRAADMMLFDPEGAFSRVYGGVIVGTEMERQDKMWGAINERADTTQGQLVRAALAQLQATCNRDFNGDADAFSTVPPVYPEDWSGFRDYGSSIANLAVVAAYIQQEIRRRIRAGESEFRKPRDPVAQPYTKDQPAEIAS